MQAECKGERENNKLKTKVTLLVLIQLAIVLVLIFIGARVGGIGLGIYGMVGVFILVFIFGMHPGKIPIDVMLIIASVITATAALQAAGGLDYLVSLSAKFLRKHPAHITYYGPLTTWLFCLVAGTAHTSYSLLPIISQIAKNSKIRPERPMTVAAINFDTTGTTRIGKYVLNHSFQLSGWITTIVSIGIGYMIITFLY